MTAGARCSCARVRAQQVRRVCGRKKTTEVAGFNGGAKDNQDPHCTGYSAERWPGDMPGHDALSGRRPVVSEDTGSEFTRPFFEVQPA